MTGWIFAVSGTITDGIIIFLCLFLIQTWAGYKKEEFRTAALVTAVSLAVLSGLFHFAFHMPDYPVLVLQVVLVSFAGVRLYKIRNKMALFLAVEYAMAVCLWDFILCCVVGIVLHAETIPGRGTGGKLAADWILCLFIGVLTCFLYKRREEEQAVRRILSRTAVAGLLLTVSLSQQQVVPIGEDEFFTPLILALVLLTGMLVYYTQRQYEKEKELVELKSMQKELLERDYRRLNEVYAGNAKLFHDFHNHMTILGQLLEEGKTGEASAYLEDIRGPVKKIAKTIWTGDETMDFLINSKLMAAKEKQIQVEVNIEFPRQTGIRSADLCAVMGNLLDNALEAAGGIKNSRKPVIRLTIRRINYMLIIKVQNTCENPPMRKNGELKTTKKDDNLHGWGLKSAAAAAEKYNGTLQTCWEDCVFTATAVMCYEEKAKEYSSN